MSLTSLKVISYCQIGLFQYTQKVVKSFFLTILKNVKIVYPHFHAKLVLLTQHPIWQSFVMIDWSLFHVSPNIKVHGPT